MAKAPYTPEEDYEDEVDYKNTENDRNERILIERREVVGEVVSSLNGSEPMVVAAFTMAGRYLNDHASKDEDPITIQFEYHGVKFIAAYGMEE